MIIIFYFYLIILLKKNKKKKKNNIITWLQTLYISIPLCFALASLNGQSKLSPLYVTNTDGFVSIICSKNLFNNAA